MEIKMLNCENVKNNVRIKKNGAMKKVPKKND